MISGTSLATLFRTWTNEASMNLPIYIDGQAVPTLKNPKVLGITLDPMLSFKPHTQKLNKVRLRNNVLKALAGSSWGMVKRPWSRPIIPPASLCLTTAVPSGPPAWTTLAGQSSRPTEIVPPEQFKAATKWQKSTTCTASQKLCLWRTIDLWCPSSFLSPPQPRQKCSSTWL